MMPFIPRQEPFACEHCGEPVEPLEHGSCRNHCPRCLYSKHVDDAGPGDRASSCRGLMEPTSIDQKNGEWLVIHRCKKCGKQMRNKSAPDDDIPGFLRRLAIA